MANRHPSSIVTNRADILTKRIRWVGHSEFWNSTTSRIIGIVGKCRVAGYCTENKITSKFTSSVSSRLYNVK